MPPRRRQRQPRRQEREEEEEEEGDAVEELENGSATDDDDDGGDGDDIGELKRRYYDPEDPASFGGIDKLQRNTGIARRTVENFLHKQSTYGLHKRRRINFRRRRVQVWGVDSQWQADLVEMQKYKRVNQGYRYLLTVIDIFSKYAWVKPLHDKTGHSITEAFSQI